MSRTKIASPALRSLMWGLNSQFSYIFCLLVSNALTGIPIFGGALYMCTRVGVLFFSTCVGPSSVLLPQKARQWRIVMLVLMLLMNLFLIIVFPLQLSSYQLWLVTAVVGCMLVRDTLSQRIVHRFAVGRLSRNRLIAGLALSHGVPALFVLWTFLYNLLSPTGWLLLAGYMAEDFLALYLELQDREKDTKAGSMTAGSVPDVVLVQESLRNVNAYRMYTALTFCLMIALITTTVLINTILMVTVEGILTQMLIAFGVCMLFYEGTEFIMRRRKRIHRADPTNLMIFGLFLWFYGLVMFRRLLPASGPQMPSFYFCMGLCTAGCTLCLNGFWRMEEAMLQVAVYSTGETAEGVSLLRARHIDVSVLIGEMAALIVLTLTCFLAERDHTATGQKMLETVQPLLVIPVIIMLLGALLFTFRFPLSRRSMDKLDWLLNLRQEGKKNTALEKQMQEVVVDVHRQPFGTSLIKFSVRVLFRHKLKGVEKIHLDNENPLVFLCNHGELYGPLICASFFPVPMRPWVISKLCVDPEEFAQYYLKYALKDKNWIPEKMKLPLSRTIGRLSTWCMRQLEAVPVYREDPVHLLQTFRKSVEAMQAGDNLLIFPENPNAVAQDHGYERDGLGEFFNGFMMLATLYYRKTGKNCRFQPCYAHRASRTLCFGNEVVFNPKAPEEDEIIRVVEACSAEMRRLCAVQDELMAQQKKRA